MTAFTPKKQETFIEELRKGKSVAAAAEMVCVSRQTVYLRRNADPAFADEWDTAIEIGTDRLEDTALKRAEDGSDTLLIFLLKARRPEKFKDRFESHTTVTHRFTDLDDKEIDAEIIGMMATLGPQKTAH